MKIKIKSVTAYKRNRIQDIPDNEIPESKLSYKEYDENNNLTKDINYNGEGMLEQMLEYKYNEKNHLIEEILYYDENEIAERSTFEVNDEGKKIKETKHYQDGSFDTVTFKYNSDNNLIEILTVDSDGEVEEKNTFDYDCNKKLIKEETYDCGNNLIFQATYKYDDAGNNTESTKWHAEDDERTSVVHIYEGNKKTESKTYNSSGELVFRTWFTEDDKGRIIQLIEEDAYNKNTITLAYDENGNATKEEERNSMNEINYSVERKFDDHNKVVESTVFIDRRGKGLNQDYTIRYMYETS